jgi:hypothetical protein
VISGGVAAVGSGSGTAVTAGQLFRVPAGPATLLLANVGTASPVYAAPGTAVTTSNGFPIPSGLTAPVVVPVYAGAPAQTWSVTCTSGTGSLAWLVSEPSGGTGI